jgi:hypothetical protein
MLVSCLAYSSTLKIEAKSSSETSVDFQLTTLHYIPEDRTLRAILNFTKRPVSVSQSFSVMDRSSNHHQSYDL